MKSGFPVKLVWQPAIIQKVDSYQKKQSVLRLSLWMKMSGIVPSPIPIYGKLGYKVGPADPLGAVWPGPHQKGTNKMRKLNIMLICVEVTAIYR